MRSILALAVLAGLSACASDEYSKVPAPSGEWVPVNPPSLTAAASSPVQPALLSGRAAR